jgi:hypothetical protein
MNQNQTHKTLEEMEDDGSIVNVFNSEKFKLEIKRIIEAETWDKGLPKYYMDNAGWLVEHWKNGEIKRIKKIKDLD